MRIATVTRAMPAATADVRGNFRFGYGLGLAHADDGDVTDTEVRLTNPGQEEIAEGTFVLCDVSDDEWVVNRVVRPAAVVARGEDCSFRDEDGTRCNNDVTHAYIDEFGRRNYLCAEHAEEHNRDDEEWSGRGNWARPLRVGDGWPGL